MSPSTPRTQGSKLLNPAHGPGRVCSVSHGEEL
ncbi:hypothetical protein PDE_01283 [Penicillium oxalicum 114-2]|uniref:Uncharacterized protein n=1 Tax=Penicillium oxalicum (strain 114-2 / CGMCC 5302) TaxID=933388 RepID=S8AWV0_PENO1|nr:hypothetical protein PDE_01283 [Penicillium oxalicum 114-2]